MKAKPWYEMTIGDLQIFPFLTGFPITILIFLLVRSLL